MRGLKQELQPYDRDYPTKIYCDNQSTIYLGMTNSNHPRTKHIDIRHHYIREKKMVLEYMKTENMITDLHTKALSQSRFEKLRGLWGLQLIK